MNDAIGTAAGKVWGYLDKNGPASSTKITTVTKLNKSEVQRAIGWLACEGKLDFETKGRNETISLR
ncbi:hypothetical protein BJAS_P1967 [Bathymodiolus japonicus methanotrophic gill symbiont]|uniref:winged helix-turn-helix domain-containing protein n=1 Tax=Bathymodiolus japonicus methanotrophic gill symbiont TaxID=113269 RepID=UPI001B780CE4|nr:winged helix-turn-helix domain-containing protein [Bathymodiolus japonicus methanotrophic gill symbiont]GFO72050.1 hypothetical protein BJAS_P1967 [Bathymodiolus japonicus methanotrophic gill symbiont]